MTDTYISEPRLSDEGKCATAATLPHYRLATLQDELHLLTLFSRMLRELAQVGHNILPTEHNIDTFTQLFMDAILVDEHGIVLAFAGNECIGATFFTPDVSGVDTPGRVAVAHGTYVSPDWRKQGVAQAMQRMAHSHLSQLGYTKLVSVVMKDNEAGLKSALAVGAHVVGHFTSVNLSVEDF